MKRAVATQSLPAAELAGRLTELLLGEAGHRPALLHGSAASGKMRPDSDIDLLGDFRDFARQIMQSMGPP